MGKGAAIKTALRFLKENFPYKNMTVAVMDADGQHTPVDMANVIEMAYIKKNVYVLGVRKMNKEMPVKSRIGNLITRILFVMRYRYRLFTATGKIAYNLDGGHCSFMTFQGNVAGVVDWYNPYRDFVWHLRIVCREYQVEQLLLF